MTTVKWTSPDGQMPRSTPGEQKPRSAPDGQLMTRALKDFAAHTRFPVVFGGYVHDGSVRVSTVLGNRTRSLEGLVVKPERGLGGRAITELRPRMTPDYRSSRQITHDYDGHVLGEGLSTLLAVPIVVGGAVRGVLYGGAWAESSVGDVVAAPAFRVAQEVATELRIRDEVERRVAALRPATGPVAVTAPSESTTDAAQREELRASYAELRSIVASVDDAGLRARLSAIEERLAGLTGGGSEPAEPLDIHLSPRELDVLACAALGSTNAEIAATLGVREGTVKSYLQTAMGKLDASTRHAAVTKARRAGILP